MYLAKGFPSAMSYGSGFHHGTRLVSAMFVSTAQERLPGEEG